MFSEHRDPVVKDTVGGWELQDSSCSGDTPPVLSPDAVEQYSNLTQFTLPRLGPGT